MNKTRTGGLTIGRRSCSNREDFVSISIVDSLSRLEVVEAQIPLKDFSRALLGLAEVPADILFEPDDRLGKKREHKQELVKIPKSPYEASLEEKLEALYEYEVDGWGAIHSDLSNKHGYEENGVRVTFERWVDEGEEE